MATVVRTTKGIESLRIRIKELDKLKLAVGWFESARYDDQTPVAGVAAVQEFGSPAKGIPPRPFMRTAIAENQDNWAKIVEQGARSILSGKDTANSVMEKLGLFAVGNVKEKISTITNPALAQATIDNRLNRRANKKTVGSLTKPLVDTGTMLATVTHEVGE